MAAVGDLLGLDSPGVPAPGAESVAGSASSGSDGAADRPSTGAQDLDEQSDAQISYLYHEPQLSSLCGVHALNNLLQGPYFGAGDLAEVGARIDATEARLLHGSAYTDRPLSARHVDAYSGDFSIEVLRSALEEKLGLRLFNSEHEEVVVDTSTAPEAEDGYLCHRQSHWFALRSVGGLWFSVDSRLQRPRLISEETLGAFLRHLKSCNGTAFVLRPAPILDILAEADEDEQASHWRTRSPAGASTGHAAAPATHGKPRGSGSHSLPAPKQPSRGRADAGDEKVWYAIEHIVGASCASDPYPADRIGAPIGDDEESAAAAAACAIGEEDSDGFIALRIAQEEADAADVKAAWRLQTSEIEAARQGGSSSVSGRSRGLLNSLGSAFSRPFPALGGGGSGSSGHAGHTGHVVHGGVTGWAGGAAPPPPSNEWQAHSTPEGRAYYHSPATGVTTWERPPGDHISPGDGNGSRAVQPPPPTDARGAPSAAGAQGQPQWWPPASEGQVSYLPSTVPGASSRPLPPGLPPSISPSSSGGSGHTPTAPTSGRRRPSAPSRGDGASPARWALEQSLSKHRPNSAPVTPLSKNKPNGAPEQPFSRNRSNGAPEQALSKNRTNGTSPIVSTGLVAVKASTPSREQALVSRHGAAATQTGGAAPPSSEDAELAWALAESLKSSNGGALACDDAARTSTLCKTAHPVAPAGAVVSQPLIVFGPD